MRSLRWQFVLSHLIPILVILPLLALGLLYLLESQVLLTEMSTDITAEANLIAENLGAQPDALSDSSSGDAFVEGMGIYVRGQVSVLLPSGDLLATTDPTLDDQVGELLDIPGIEEALSGEQSVTISYGVFEHSAVVLVPVLDINEQLVGIVGVTESLDGIANQVKEARTLVLLSFVMALLLSILIGYWLARRLERPISAVSSAVTEIASGERVDPIPVKGATEIKQLIGSVNFLAERLFKLEDTRKRLLANLIHEIGRPLGAMRAAVHVMQQGAGDDPDIRAELLDGIAHEINQMEPLLDDLSQLHGTVLGTFELERQPIDLNSWLAPVLRPWQASAEEKGLLWQEALPDDLPSLEIDPSRMAQVFGNLLSNAVKYTPTGGRVRVSAEVQPRAVQVHIQDNGPGISPDEQEKIFDPFFRSTQQRRFPQGLGLGLTIARDIVTAHQGTLTVESSAEGGSTFTITLPR